MVCFQDLTLPVRPTTRKLGIMKPVGILDLRMQKRGQALRLASRVNLPRSPEKISKETHHKLIQDLPCRRKRVNQLEVDISLRVRLALPVREEQNRLRCSPRTSPTISHCSIRVRSFNF